MVTIRVETRVGDRRVVVEGDNNSAVIEELSFWESLPSACPECGAPWRFVFLRDVEGGPSGTFDARKLQCEGEPPHSMTLGTHKGTATSFYRAHERWYELGSSGGRRDAGDRDEPEDRRPAPRQEPQRREQRPRDGRAFDERVGRDGGRR